MKTPRVKFCFHCGRKLRGRHHVEKVYEGHSRVFHKACYKDLMENGPGYEDGPWAEGWDDRSERSTNTIVTWGRR